MKSLNFDQAQFVVSAASLATCPVDSIAEVAFAGRSNAGKSSAINSITRQSRLARISKTPGRTQLINFFKVVAGKYLVDLPGYGFAKVPLQVRDNWQLVLDQYLRERQALRGIILLSDIRHPLKDFDRMMIEWSFESQLPMHILLTKADKLKRGAAQNTLLGVQKEFVDCVSLSFQLFSSLKNTGIETASSRLSEWLTQADAE